MKNFIVAILLVSLLAGCRDSAESPYFREIEYLFNDNMEGWKVMFSDFPVDQKDSLELESGLVKLPEPLDTNLYAVKISGNNHSDDLFSYMYVPVSGLSPHTTYKATFTIFLASNVSTNSVDNGESSDLALGAGALDTIPVNIIDESDWYRPSFTVNLQSGESNEIMKVLGNLGVSPTTTEYTAITRHNYGDPMDLTTNGDGMMYVLVGWDSGFEGITTIYIKTIILRLEL